MSLFDDLPAPELVYNLRNTLRKLGYDARIANFMCFDIHVAGCAHYLSFEEASQLATSIVEHPIDLMMYSVCNGLNYWYTFPQE